MAEQSGFQRGQHKMIKKLFFMVVLGLPPLAFAQTTAPVRPNHTLPQYGALMTSSSAEAPRAMLRMATPSETGRYSPLWPPGGLRKDTRVPSLYADGSSGTLEEIGRMADSSVQQQDANKANGYARPDSDGNITLPIIGDSSFSPVIANSSVSSRTLSDRFSDVKNIKDFGINLDGTDTTASISDALENVSSEHIINVPSGKWINHLTTFSKPRFLNILGPMSNVPNYILAGNINGERVALPDYGDGNSVYRVGSFGEPVHERIDRSGNGYVPGTTYWYVNASPQKNVQHSGLASYAASEVGAGGNTTGTDLQLYSEGAGYSGSFDVDLSILTRAYGSNWAWGEVNQFSELGGLDVSGGALSHSTSEWDFTGAGPEVSSSSFWPGNGSRSLYYTNAWLSCGRCQWVANTPYVAKHMIRVTATDGTDSLFVATNGGSTGAVRPVWSKSSESITDGSVVWKYLSPYELQISKVFYLNKTASVHYGALLASDADYYDAAIDLSKSTYSGVNPAVLRTKEGVGIDFTGDGTSSGQNNHYLAHSNGGLSYNVNDKTVFNFGDDGVPQVTVSTISASGTTISDATIACGYITYINIAASGAGVKVPQSLFKAGKIIKIYNAATNSVNVYPIDEKWRFDNHANAAPIVLPSHAALTLYTPPNTGNIIAAEYSPPAP
ncbi:hypothetical protein [Acetobacter persici]|uniref:hypothetical protein n=1 Tax=Acetobacter persici TaxID=1076596 RepID=UPI0039EA52FC